MPMRHFVTDAASRLKTSIAQRPTGAIVSGHMISRRGFLGGSVALRAAPLAAPAQPAGRVYPDRSALGRLTTVGGPDAGNRV